MTENNARKGLGLFFSQPRPFHEVQKAANDAAIAAAEKRDREKREADAAKQAAAAKAAEAAASAPAIATTVAADPSDDYAALSTRKTPSAGERKPTAEQEAIIDAARRGKTVKAIAGAGAAKTTSLSMAAEATKGRRTAFLVYNKAAEVDAKARFPEYVDVSTAHSFAFRALGGAFSNKIQRRPFAENVARLAGLGEDSRAGVAILKAISNFCLSVDEDFLPAHFVDAQDHRALLDGTRKVWQAMSDSNNDFPATHDVYLKVWAMSNERPRYDMIYVDEAQDMWPSISAAVKRMGIPTIYVGDPFQQIYSFRGAVNALDSIAAPVLPLTLSWRFGPRIADLANDLLGLRSAMRLSAPSFKLRGQEALQSKWEIGNDPKPRLERGSFAYLCRTNAGIIQAALEAKNSTIHIVGGGEEVFAQIEDAWLINQMKPAKSYEMRRFRNWTQLVNTAEVDIEMKLAVKLVEDYGSKLPSVLNSIRQRVVAERQADIVLSSMHRSKGREWDEVALGSDMVPIYELYRRQAKIEDRGGRFDATKIGEELNLAYVAATRAKKLMRIPESMSPSYIAGRIASIDQDIASKRDEMETNKAATTPVMRRIGGNYRDLRREEPREAPRERSVMDAAGWSGDRAGGGQRRGWRP